MIIKCKAYKISLVICCVFAQCCFGQVFAQQNTIRDSSKLITSLDTKQHFLQLLNQAQYIGLDKSRYNYDVLKSTLESKTNSLVESNEILFSNSIIEFSKDIYSGCDIAKLINNDEISSKYFQTDLKYITDLLQTAKTIADFDAVMTSFEPVTQDYKLLKAELRKQIDSCNAKLISNLKTSLNLSRWINHFHFDQYIIVNIASLKLNYYEAGIDKLEMKVVVGRPNRTPRIATYCNQIVLYPYWNVPRSIATKELLPKVKRNPFSLAGMNMEVIDRKGKIVNPHSVNWKQYNAGNFPFRFRQCTGCENALGVIKFNLTDSLSIYLHDTNYKRAFESKSRYLSHGCIRVAKPIELANHLLDNKLDSNLIKACLKNQIPMVNKLSKAVPVFIIYSLAEAEADSIVYHKDIYHLAK